MSSMELAKKPYFLSLDMDRNAVGYAVTDPAYNLLKVKGEPLWGVHIFDAGETAEVYRMSRANRRNINRKKQRLSLLSELFAEELAKVDENFLTRRKESFLFPEDSQFGTKIFQGGMTDKEYYTKYPTIHHLLNDLMTNPAPHDIRLVFIAVSYLLAYRGHFHFDIAIDNMSELSDFQSPYNRFCAYFTEERQCSLPWAADIPSETLESLMKQRIGVREKQMKFKHEFFDGKNPSKEPDPDFPFSRFAIMQLICGGAVKPAALFCKEEYADITSVDLRLADDKFDAVLAELDSSDADLLSRLRGLQDCVLLIETLNGCASISEAKIQVYEQHKKDLASLKYFVKKYFPDRYGDVFTKVGADNYLAYSGNAVKLNAEARKEFSKTTQEAFCEFLKKFFAPVTDGTVFIEDKDRERFDLMLNDINLGVFMPKQKAVDNRIIPQQLKYYELKVILDNAEGYLPFLREKDETGLSVKDKVLSIFSFKIPYFVGPLNPASPFAWIERKQGKIYPWNFNEMVDLDATEDAFIRKLTGKCTYLPGEDVLPEHSLLYIRFKILNQINCISINGRPLSVQTKQDLFNEVFLNNNTVSVTKIETWLRKKNELGAKEHISGLDKDVKISTVPYYCFNGYIQSGKLSALDAETIIERGAYSEDTGRFCKWLAAKYPTLDESDVKLIGHINLKKFGRLSGAFLTELMGIDRQTGEVFSILDALWNTNYNLMQLLSDRFTFSDAVVRAQQDYYTNNSLTQSDKLDALYISNSIKRPINRGTVIMDEIAKYFGGAPERIFLESSKADNANRLPPRMKPRAASLKAIYKFSRDPDVKVFAQKLDELENKADNYLQSDKLYLWFLQLGRCAYTGEEIKMEDITSGNYNIEHIYPQQFVKDENLANNLLLVKKDINKKKDNIYPVDSDIQEKMLPFWDKLYAAHLMNDEKYKRLTRTSEFTKEEKQAFINRDLVDSSITAKAMVKMVRERFPESKIIFVKGSMVSEFRQAFNMYRCTSISPLYHAKDAFLNIVVGNVYFERFTSRFFDVERDSYNVQIDKIFSYPRDNRGDVYWRGLDDVKKVRATIHKNAIHYSKYPYYRTGQLFKLTREKAGTNLVPLKKNLPAERYGGYGEPASAFYVLAKCKFQKKTDLIFVAIAMIDKAAFETDPNNFVRREAEKITGKQIEAIEFPLGLRKLKINTLLNCNGLLFTLNGKASNGTRIVVGCMSPLLLSPDQEAYLQILESYQKKARRMADYLPNERYITAAQNIDFYDTLTEKLNKKPFAMLPGNQFKALSNGRDLFLTLDLKDQITVLLNVVALFGPYPSGVDLRLVGGKSTSGAKSFSSNMSNWRKNFTNVRIVEQSASGIWSNISGNLLDMF